MLTNFIKKINVIFITNNLVVSENCVNTHLPTISNSRNARNIYPFLQVCKRSLVFLADFLVFSMCLLSNHKLKKR